MAPSERRTSSGVERRLREWFEHSGWLHSAPDPRERARRKLTYKRGYEVRLSAAPHEAQELLRLLQRAGFQPGTPFEKAQRMVFPLYGKEQVQRFVQLVGSGGTQRAPRARSARRTASRRARSPRSRSRA